jgi:hypothetical protein
MARAFAAGVLALTLLASPAIADDPVRPDSRLTPGAILTTDTGLDISCGMENKTAWLSLVAS